MESLKETRQAQHLAAHGGEIQDGFEAFPPNHFDKYVKTEKFRTSLEQAGADFRVFVVADTRGLDDSERGRLRDLTVRRAFVVWISGAAKEHEAVRVAARGDSTVEKMGVVLTPKRDTDRVLEGMQRCCSQANHICLRLDAKNVTAWDTLVEDALAEAERAQVLDSCAFGRAGQNAGAGREDSGRSSTEA